MPAPRTAKRTKPRQAPEITRAAKAAPPRASKVVPTPKAGDVRERYWEAVGRRKTAIARVRLYARGHGATINDKALAGYFPYSTLQDIATEALGLMNVGDRMRMSVRVSGGGLRAQSEAIRHGSARALVRFNPEFRKRLKRTGFLTRDPRMKERKKFGLKGARRAPQWQKR